MNWALSALLLYASVFPSVKWEEILTSQFSCEVPKSEYKGKFEHSACLLVRRPTRLDLPARLQIQGS